jgi:hypothetical protein
MNEDEILAQVQRCNVELFLLDGRLKACPPGVLPAELRAAIREKASEIKARFRAQQNCVLADRALQMLKRLKGYTLPAGQMQAARPLAARMRGLTDAGEIVSALQNFERELITMGGEYDCQLAEAIAAVERAFPGARLL